MTLHLVKLCVGISSVQELRSRIAEAAASAGLPVEAVTTSIVTRSAPTRADEILGGGSLYWVIKGHVCARQPILGINPFTDGAGTGRCQIVLGPEVIDVEPRKRGAFQGWRYLEEGEAPRDVGAGATGDLDEMPDAMRRELAEMGLL